ncbi:MAG: hypothetical protein K2Q25_02305 [Mycobacteriaceae bacterium]|nr:hypothetical protein [Mycobacteriaceae bacterium]
MKTQTSQSEYLLLDVNPQTILALYQDEEIGRIECHDNQWWLSMEHQALQAIPLTRSTSILALFGGITIPNKQSAQAVLELIACLYTKAETTKTRR